MKESDQLTTSFITPFGSFCYVTMPFGLKNVGATYQRYMLKCFADLIGQTVKAYLEHTLKIHLGSKPVKQRLHRFDEVKRRAISVEIAKLLATGFIKEVYHPSG